MTRFSRISPPRSSGRKPALFASTAVAALARFALCGLTGSLALAANAQGLPTGGTVAAGQASISATGGAMTIQQSTSTAVLNRQSFDIAAGKSVDRRRLCGDRIA